MEIFTKIIISIVASGVLILWVLGYIKTMKWTWHSQIDTRETVKRFLTEKPDLVQNVVSRDENKIYQNGKIVGEITGAIETREGFTIFKQLCETSNLDRNVFFEHKRDKYQIVKIERSMGMKIVASTKSSEQKNAVLENVYCRKVE